jgi:hypothetical protein
LAVRSRRGRGLPRCLIKFQALSRPLSAGEPAGSARVRRYLISANVPDIDPRDIRAIEPPNRRFLRPIFSLINARSPSSRRHRCDVLYAFWHFSNHTIARCAHIEPPQFPTDPQTRAHTHTRARARALVRISQTSAPEAIHNSAGAHERSVSAS